MARSSLGKSSKKASNESTRTDVAERESALDRISEKTFALAVSGFLVIMPWLGTKALRIR
jgi:hypothetical protein